MMRNHDKFDYKKIPFIPDECINNTACVNIFIEHFGDQLSVVKIPKGAKDEDIIKNGPNIIFTKNKKHKNKFSSSNNIVIYISNSNISSKEITIQLTKLFKTKGFKNKDIRYWIKKYKGNILGINKQDIKKIKSRKKIICDTNIRIHTNDTNIY